MPRKPIGEKAMTDAERQARYRIARAADAPVIRTRRPADHRSRARRCRTPSPPRYAPPAARRARRYARVPPMDSGDEPLPMIKRGPFSVPMGGPFSTPIDTRWRRAPCCFLFLSWKRR